MRMRKFVKLYVCAKILIYLHCSVGAITVLMSLLSNCVVKVLNSLLL